jgi:hypothetical protein
MVKTGEPATDYAKNYEAFSADCARVSEGWDERSLDGHVKNILDRFLYQEWKRVVVEGLEDYSAYHSLAFLNAWYEHNQRDDV